MKRISFLLAAAMLATPVAVRAQDAAVEERLNKLSAQIQDLIDARDAQNKRIEDLARQLRELQDQQSRGPAGYATQGDLKQLAAKLKEVDDKRQQDNEHIVAELEKLGKTLGSAGPRKPSPASTTTAPRPATPDRGYEYEVQAGDSISAIARAYSDKGIKVTVDQILKANPGLKPEKLQIGQKVFIPAPQP